MTNLSYSDKSERYEEFEASIQKNLDAAVSGNKKLFTTNAEGLFQTHLTNLPQEKQEHYNCRACRKFIDGFGDLVVVDAQGNKTSAVFNLETTPPMFIESVTAVLKSIEESKITGVFVSNQRTLGQPLTGVWSHLSLQLPSQFVNRSVLKDAHQVMAEFRQDFEMTVNATRSYSLDTVEKAITLIQAEVMYRSGRLLENAKWFKEVLVAKDNTNSEQWRNIVWNAVAKAPVGFTHIRSSMIGTLLDDIANGVPMARVQANFEEKMSTFMRSTATPSENALYEAGKTIEKLGLEDSLERRYARFDEIATAWTPKESKVAPTRSERSAGVFANLVSQAKDADTTPNLDIPAKLMTWEKFNESVLPNANKVEVLLDNASRFMAMVTAVNPEAENILQWENPFSWYYHGGVDGEMKRRVEQAGGRFEDNEIRATLIWETRTDLDIHCITPSQGHIYYGNHRSGGGHLDVDMNVSGETTKPVENIRWVNGAPNGTYKFYVHNYTNRKDYNPFKVELEVGGQIYTFQSDSNRAGERIDAFHFDYHNGTVTNMRTQESPVTVDNAEAWGVEMNQFKEVKAVTYSPNLWTGNNDNSGTHVFFLMDGVQDKSEGKGRGFFNEMLKPELREIRRVLELYTKNSPIQNPDDATACGVGYSKDSEWGLTLRVTEGSSTRMIKIDRWD